MRRRRHADTGERFLIFSVSFYVDTAFPGYVDSEAEHPAVDVDDAIRLLTLYLDNLVTHRDEMLS